MAANQVGARLIALLVLAAPLVLALVAVVAGVAARRRVRQSDGALRGEGLATAGLICGGITLLAAAGLMALGVAGWALSARTARTMTPVVVSPGVRGVAVPAPPGAVAPVDEDPFEEEMAPAEGGGEDAGADDDEDGGR